MSAGPARVAVLGGGFAGLYAAAYLATADVPEGAVRATLVSRTNHFTFTPLLSEVVGGNLGREHVALPYRILARRYGFDFLLADVEGLDPDERVVHTSEGAVPFDYAIVCLGAGPRFFGRDELRERALPLSSVADALAIRDRMICLAERIAQERSPERRRALGTVVVAGAGPAGVEAAGEISHLFRRVLPRYYDLGDAPRVVLVDAGDRILRGWDEELARRGLDELRASGMEVRLRTAVRAFDGGAVRLAPAGDGASEGDEDGDAGSREGERGDGGERIEARTLVWTAGTAPAAGPLADSRLSLSRSGHLEVDDRLRVFRQDRVYAAGDVALLSNPRTGRPFPPVAPIAISQGVRAAGNVVNVVLGRPQERYRAHHAGKIISLGGGTAFVDVLGYRLTGRLAWAVFRATYLLKLVGAQNKVRTATTLLLNRLFERDLSRVR